MLKPIRVILLLSAIFIYFLAPAQLFNRTEDRIGLQDLRDNNGVSVADYDGDNDLDLFVVSIYEDTDEDPLTFSKLFRNNNDGTFTDVTEESGLVDLMPKGELGAFNFKGLAGRKYGASWADYDNDGHVDIFFTHLATLQLFRNMGDGTFQNVTEQTGIPERNNCGNTGATWFDYNNDSYLDVYISDWKECPYNSMYRNNGDGTFTDVSDIITDFDAEFYANYMSIPFDFNKDGFMDLYVSTDLFDPNQLFINQNGTSFTEEGADYGVDVSQDDMGVAIADLNQDSHFDIAVTSIDRNYLLVDDGDANFSDETAFNKVEETGWAWGVTFGDFDLDGDEDLFIVNGFDIGNRGPETNVFYDSRYMQEDNSFEILEAGLEDFGISVEGLHFDYDNDGDLDLIVTNSDRTTMFYDNQTIIDPQNPDGLLWFKVSLEGTTSNRSAIGTIVEVNTTLGDYYRYFSGVGFLGQSIQPVHFGLETGAAIESVQITWPSGLVEVHNGIDVNTHIKATEGSGFEVLPQNYAEKAQGCIDPDSCNYDPDAILDDGSCEYLDVPQTITGAAVTGYFKQETYGFPLQPGQTISWGVEGGEIVSGHISQEVIVRWSLEEQGRVFAVIRDENCASEEVSLNVTVTISQIEENISVARIWNEALLYAIRNDFARPTVHARNLFHTSAAMYDVWAIYNSTHPYLIGNELNGYSNGFEPFNTGQATADDIDEAISFAAYRLLVHRFQNSPNAATTRQKFNDLMNQLGYSTGLSGLNYASGDPAQLGNFVAQSYIDYGLQDGSRESSDYDNAYYQPVNEALAPTIQGNTTISDPNRWQPLSLDTFIDQSGNLIPGETIDFLSPEWGNVYPFSMTDANTIVYNRSGNNYIVFNDPGAPPYIGGQGDEAYKWGFSLVSIWSAHLDPNDGIMWDISPNSIGNMSSADFPLNYTTLPQFFDVFDGGVNSQGYSSNPVTGQPYEEQIVPRGDYTRVLAEFWADGPDSETPPGHWFTILNTVNDHPDLTRQFNGQGEPLEPLE
nr:CRTAC1 family protein [Saprospiraceae bacterium]